MQVKIERLVHRGLGLAKVQGKSIFIPAVLPGETVSAEIIREKASYAYAQLDRVLEPSPWRISPECPYFPACGGCHFAHIDYQHQLTLKQEILRESLIRIGKFDPQEKLENLIPAPAPLRYRTRIRFHLCQGEIGFQQFQSREFIKIEDCLLAKDELRATFPALKKLIQQLPQPKENAIELDLNPETKEIFALFSPSKRRSYQYLRGVFEKIAPGRKTWLRLNSFVQANPEQNQKMIELVTELAEKTRAKTCLELFAGAGNFSFALAGKLESLTAIESNRSAVELAELQKKELQAGNVKFLAQSAENYLRLALKNKIRFELVVLDPPRTGARKEMEKIIELKPKAIIYVSCEPATLARDLKILLAAGYELEKIIPLDMFPQTYHLESISLLQKIS